MYRLFTGSVVSCVYYVSRKMHTENGAALAAKRRASRDRPVMENLVAPAKQSPKKQQSPSATSSESSTDDSGPTTPLQDCNVEPRPALVEQCLRPRHCSLPEGDAREWMHRRLSHLGHVFNERGATYMA